MDFNTMYSTYQGQLKAVAKSFLRNEEDANDAVQDTFLEAYQSFDSYNDKYSLSTWLTQICMNKCRDKLRKRSRENRVITYVNDDKKSLLDKVEDQATPELLLQATEDQFSINAEYDELPENIKLVVKYKLVDELSYKEIAEKMGVPLGTAKTWMRRGRKKLLSTISPR